jgi:hypothetical protein
MPFDLAPIAADAPSIIGAVGGVLGIISSVAVFARRRPRLVVSISENYGDRQSWHTVSIANRSDLATSYRDFALGWFIMTPLGRLHLDWALRPEEETNVFTLPPQGIVSFRISGESWTLPEPKERRQSAYLRAYIYLPSRSRSVWLPVHMVAWREGNRRERLLRRLYGRSRPSNN